MVLDICNSGWYGTKDVQQEEGHFFWNFQAWLPNMTLVVNVFAPLSNWNILDFYGLVSTHDYAPKCDSC